MGLLVLCRLCSMNRRIGYHPDCVVALPLVVREWRFFLCAVRVWEGGGVHASLQFRADHPLASFVVCGASLLAGWQKRDADPGVQVFGSLESHRRDWCREYRCRP